VPSAAASAADRMCRLIVVFMSFLLRVELWTAELRRAAAALAGRGACSAIFLSSGGAKCKAL
jgi:hypothetical protein